MSAFKLKADYEGMAAGTPVYRLRFHDYGLASDDSRITGEPYVSVTLKADGDYPSFTIPKRLLEPCE